MSNINHNEQNEIWISQYRQLESSLEAWDLSHGNINNEDEDDEEEEEYLVGLAAATRACRLGALQCALLDEGEDMPTIRNLLEITKQEMDADAASERQVRLLERRTKNQSRHLNVSPEACTDVDLDAFFQSYPECIKSDWDSRQSSSENGSDDGSDSGSSERYRSKKEKKESSRHHHHGGDTVTINDNDKDKGNNNNNNVVNNHNQNPAPSSQLQRQTSLQQRPFPSHGRKSPSTAQTAIPLNNPYNKKKEPRTEQSTQQNNMSIGTGRQQNLYQDPQGGAFAFSYTPPSGPTTEDSQILENRTNKPAQTSQSSFAPYAHMKRIPSMEKRPATTAVDNSSWEDHQNRQNPFKTARELAQIPPPTTKQQYQTGYHHRLGGNSQQRSNSWNNASTQPSTYGNPYGTTYGNHNQPHQHHNYMHQQQPAPSINRPQIPESLKRKFQVPRRGEVNNPRSGPAKRSSAVAPARGGGVQAKPQSSRQDDNNNSDEELPEELQHLDKELVKKIQNEIMESGETITFDDIAGLDDAKQTVQEVVCWPMKRPDLFTGLRRAPNGLLLYGPPGTGKTLIGKAIAHESGATFFSISSSSLTSKWIGEGEKLVRTLFAVAAYREPAVVFLDEIDSLLTQRKATENEASRRIKTEFLVQLDGTGTSGQGRVLIIGATNRPQELDEAARRRFTKRLYIPLPSESDRRTLLNVMLKKNNHRLTEADVDKLAKDTDGFSGADLKSLCSDAAMGPIRQLGHAAMEININDVPPISFKHFKKSLRGTKPSVAPSDLTQYEEWDKIYGSKRASEEDDTDDDDED